MAMETDEMKQVQAMWGVLQTVASCMETEPSNQPNKRPWANPPHSKGKGKGTPMEDALTHLHRDCQPCG